MQILITGTGRCGTGYIAKVLTSAGVRCSHEDVFQPTGFVPYSSMPAESSWLAAPYLTKLDPRITVVHLVRHPQHVIDSLIRIRFFSRPGAWLNYAVKFMPELKRVIEDPLEKACYFYYHWNRMIEKSRRVDVFHRIEDPVQELLAKLDVDPGNRDLFDDKRYNSRGNVSRTVDLSKAPPRMIHQLRVMSRRYGYDLSRPPARP